MEVHDTPAWVLLAYLVSGICFILALRGLSSPVSSRRGNRAGMIGMAIAVVTTLAVHEIASLPEILVAIAIIMITVMIIITAIIFLNTVSSMSFPV